jgi:hypothetical protein
VVYDLSSFDTDDIFSYLNENIEVKQFLFTPMVGKIPSVMGTLVTVKLFPIPSFIVPC